MGKILFSLFFKIRQALSGKGLSEFPGSSYLYEIVYNIVGHYEEMWVSVKGSKILLNPRDKAITPHMIIDGVWEEYLTELFLGEMKPGLVVVDIGANIGYFSMLAARAVGDEGRVYAFEPEPVNHDILVRNIKVNGYRNVVAVHKALSNKIGKLRLFCDRTNFGSSSFSRENILSETRGSIEVETTTLDDYLGNKTKDTSVDIIKMDVEGAEGLVLKGAYQVLKSNDVTIFMEFWTYGLRNLGTDPLKLLQWLVRSGFTIYLIDEERHCLIESNPHDIVRICDNRNNGIEEVNLILKKGKSPPT
jgi:FkbM family methyltransferase